MKNKATKGKEMVQFTIGMLPVSENNAIASSRRGGYKTKQYKEWEEFVLLTVKEKCIKCSEWYECEVVFYFPLYFKNGKVRKKDAHNMIKYAIDTVLNNKLLDSKGERIDDSRILGGGWTSVDSEEERVEITFYTVGECS